MKILAFILVLVSTNLFAEGTYFKEVTSNNPYHIRLSSGVYKVIDKEGRQFYTKNDKFTASMEGVIIDQKGRTLSPGIKLPLNTRYIGIESNGEVTVELFNGEEQYLGIIEVFEIINNKIVDVTGDPQKAIITQGKHAETDLPNWPYEYAIE